MKGKGYTSSISYDSRLYREDIAGSIAHVKMLVMQGILSSSDADKIVSGLELISREIAEGIFPWREDLEDIHMNVEARLNEIIGSPAGKMHTARSRNDQVATDLRLYVKSAIDYTLMGIGKLQNSILDQAERHINVVMPGYTHLQRAQPVLLAHYLLAYFEMLERDKHRLQEAYIRADVLPLGSGALAGSPYPLDRNFVAKELGFSRVSANSMDAVSDRDFVLDYMYSSSVIMTHLSRLAEEMVLWSSEEFGFVRMGDLYSTGSSIMPQKRNPDFAELGRGKSGRVYGHLFGFFTTLKGLPLTYNRDLQEDKEGLFDSVDTVVSTLDAFSGMLNDISFDTDKMLKATEKGYMLATDLADYLVSRDLPFREAYGVVKVLIAYAQEANKSFDQLSLAEYQQFSPLFDIEVLKINLTSSLNSRNVPGGTAPSKVKSELRKARKKCRLPLESATNLGLKAYNHNRK